MDRPMRLLNKINIHVVVSCSTQPKHAQYVHRCTANTAVNATEH